MSCVDCLKFENFQYDHASTGVLYLMATESVVNFHSLLFCADCRLTVHRKCHTKLMLPCRSGASQVFFFNLYVLLLI
jgi:hypothetical protein